MPKICIRPVSPELFSALTQVGFSALEARLYAARGIRSRTELEHELANLLPFSSMKNIESAACMLADAIAAEKRILIIGDYDADGATATALAVRGLTALGGIIDFLVPNRFEYGYGLTPEIVTLAAERKPDLIVTVDNGIASVDGVAKAHELGMDVLITDHHLPGDVLPDALIVNPNQPGCTFPSRNLAGVGVMFYVLMALRSELRQRNAFAGRPEPNLAQWLDLVALGTVADVVKLDANNRILVEQGLKRMRSGRACAGIMALFTAAGRRFGKASCFDLGFTLGPRLNAAGRLDDMTLGISCLLADSETVALPLAQELDQMNRERREIEAGMREEAEIILTRLQVERDYSICLYQPDWHQGVIGILASRVKEKFHRPTLVFADGGDGLIKGSGRSINGLHLRDAIDLVSKRMPGLILRFGGHAAAAGLTLRAEDFSGFAQAFELVCREWMNEAHLDRIIETDGELPAEAFALDMADRLDRQVWGQDFPPPLFEGDFRVIEQRIVGERHLRLKLANCHGQLLEAMRFQSAEPLPERIRAVYKIGVNEFRNERTLQLQIEYCE